ncbi:MAG: transposase [Bacillota bacterium]|nr:transposase [Bacillota bacterium]
MGRKPRVEFYGAIYHVIQRGNNRSYIFRDEQHKMRFMEFLMEVKRDSDFRLLAYVIMDNHYHLIIQTMNERISRIMHRLNNRYSKYYNAMEIRTGVNFGERYFSKLVKEKGYLLKLVYYIHHNPTKAGIVKNTKDYQYSSDRFFRDNDDNIVNINYILNMFSNNRQNAIRQYCEMMDGLEPTDEVEVEIKKMFEAYVAIQFKGKSLDDLLKEVCPDKTIFYQIKNRSKAQHLTVLKLEYIKKAYREHYNFEEIGQNINITGSAVVKLLKRREPKWLNQSIVSRSSGSTGKLSE